jgi:hypothetical protein
MEKLLCDPERKSTSASRLRPKRQRYYTLFHPSQVSQEGFMAASCDFFGRRFMPGEKLGRKTPPFAGAKRRGRNREEAIEIGLSLYRFSPSVNYFSKKSFFLSVHPFTSFRKKMRSFGAIKREILPRFPLSLVGITPR